MMKQILHYLNNRNLKAAGVKLEYTQEQLDEYIKCSEDPIYFIKKYIKIVNVDRGLIPFEMYLWQEEWIKLVHENRFTIGKVARQSGKSIAMISYFIWVLIFRDTQNIAILANKEQTAKKLLNLMKTSYEHLPKWLQQGVIEWNKTSIQLENGSCCIANSTSSSAARGGSYTIIFMDELAFVPANVADEFFTSVYPTISSGETTKVVICSTPNGMNMFHQIFTNAELKRNKYIAFSADWRCVPWRTEKWQLETLANMGQLKFSQEFDTDFIGSQNTLISGQKLKVMTFAEPKHEKPNLKIYEIPKSNHRYVISVDTGRGQDQDYSTFTVIDITEFPYQVVARYKNNKISPILYPEIIFASAKEYNEAFIMIELNDVGSQVAYAISRELEYENMLTSVVKNGRQQLRIGTSYSDKQNPGIQMTKSVKGIGCSNLKSIIEGDQLIINDYDIYSELTTFIAKKNSFEADSECNDDLVMNLVLFGWLYNQDTFKELTDLNLKNKLMEQRNEEEKENMMPFGFVDDGETDNSESVWVDGSGDVWQVVESDKDLN